VKLTRRQHDFTYASTPRVAYVGGRGAGKTVAGCHRVLMRALPGATYLVAAPTYPMLWDITIPPLLERARQFQFLHSFHMSRMVMTLGNGAKLLLRSADNPDRLRGPNLAGAWFDEAGLMSEKARDVVRLALRGVQGAWLAATFTPNGRSHWTYPTFGSGRENTTLCRASTFDNPFLPEDFLALAKSEYTGVQARQELMGEFVEAEGVEWPAEYWGDWVLVKPEGMPDLDRYDCRVIAVDPSLGRLDRKGDYSAIIKLGIADGLLWVTADLERRRPDALVRATLQACEDFKPHWVGIEANQFQELLVHEFHRASQGRFGVAYPLASIKNTVNKQMRIRRLGPYVTRRELRVQDDKGGNVLVDQMRDFPEGSYDDGPDALEMAVRLILEMGGGQAPPAEESELKEPDAAEAA
jgi:predicted phage terminase large subunit-like protein